MLVVWLQRLSVVVLPLLFFNLAGRSLVLSNTSHFMQKHRVLVVLNLSTTKNVAVILKACLRPCKRHFWADELRQLSLLFNLNPIPSEHLAEF